MFKGRDDWFEMWYADKRSVLDTMVKNMQADLNAGYDYFGQSIKNQRMAIDTYKRLLDQELDMFADMGEKQVNRWCYYDMVKRGAIEP